MQSLEDTENLVIKNRFVPLSNREKWTGKAEKKYPERKIKYMEQEIAINYLDFLGTQKSKINNKNK